MRKLLTLAAVFAAAVHAGPTSAEPAPRGKVLIVMSGAHHLTLKDGKQYATGTYLDETVAPLRALLAAGYTPVFASPDGAAPSVDPNSENTMFYQGDAAALKADQVLFAQTEGLKHPRKLSEVASEGVAEYAGVVVPGGFAPLEDLVANPDLGRILRAFHDSGRPTGLICHGPIALLSTLPDPKAFEKAMIAGDLGAAYKLAANWPYAGYRLTVFSSTEELLAAPQLRGHPRYYVSDALSQAGAHVDHMQQGAVNVIVDRELVTGQQPFSSEAFAEAFVARLRAGQPHAGTR